MAGRAVFLLALHCVVPSFSAAKDNVAVNGTATAVAGWSSPSLAIDGRVGVSSVENCFHSATEPQDLPGWWRVDLGTVYPLDDITIHFLNNVNTVDRSSGMAVYVQNSTGSMEICTTITEPQLQSKTVSCPQTGQILELRKTTTAAEQYITLCEVQVFVATADCAANTYATGGVCTPCGRCSTGTVCDKTNGACPAGCNPGWTGSKCDTECSSGCQPRSCTQTTGDCTGGCVSGLWGPKCDQPCSAGSFGTNCSNTCGRCRDNAACNHVTGNCPAGCEAGWDGLRCLQECHDGTYWEGCTLTCGQCAGGMACDKKYGFCTACQEGFTPPLCQQGRASEYGSAYNQGLGTGVGIGIGVSCLVALIILAIVCIWHRRNQSQGSGRSKQHGRQSGEIRNADSSVYYNTAQEVAEDGDKAPYESLDAATRNANLPSHYEEMRNNRGTL